MNRNIIINANGDKQKLFRFWDFKEIIIISIWAGIGYALGHFISDLGSLVVAIIFGGIAATLYIEIRNNLTLLEIIRRFIRYMFKTPKEYFHKPKINTSIVHKYKKKENTNGNNKEN